MRRLVFQKTSKNWELLLAYYSFSDIEIIKATKAKNVASNGNQRIEKYTINKPPIAPPSAEPIFRADILRLINCSLIWLLLVDDISYCMMGPVAHWDILPINIIAYKIKGGSLYSNKKACKKKWI